jgi:hypothetical protein
MLWDVQQIGPKGFPQLWNARADSSSLRPAES